MKYSKDDIQKLVENIKIEELIGGYVELKRSGASYKGRCPFHQEKTASFMVSPAKGIYKCFGCNAGGDVLNFYMKINNVDYADAIKELAQKYRLDIKPVHGEIDEKKSQKEEKYYQIMSAALDFFKENIKSENNPGAIYFKNRDMDIEFVETYNLGYIPDAWESLFNYLKSKEFSEEEILESGLVKKNEERNSFYDVFRGRIIFPIYSPYGKIVGFGGRIIINNKETAKYLNSPETQFFEKGKNLYGLVNRGDYIRKNGYAILMEGYMDVLSAHKHGFNMSVASLGTAFTDEQAKLLKRYSSNIIISYDMDSAGIKATERAAFILKKHGFNVRAVSYSDAKDPDELLSKYGKERFIEEMKNSKEIFDYLYEMYSRIYSGDEIIAKKNLIERFKEFFKNITNKVEYSLYIEKLAKESEIDILILKDMFEPPKNEIKDIKRENTVKKGIVKRDAVYKLEFETVLIALRGKKYYEKFCSKEIKDEFLRKIIAVAKEYYIDDNLNSDIIEDENFYEEERKELVNIIYSAETIGECEEYFQDISEIWEKSEYENMYRVIEEELKNSNISSEKKRELFLKKFELLKKIKN
jgi:DNA primase